ncbi:hypothetical protein TWF506_001276 [Arthrobotrys conoides]|uniref:F-box domain-containing protein n=1 Tax=Arthrobotrys conoides TaxID=74498 RepID=A0AAN8S1N8_9PEZI
MTAFKFLTRLTPRSLKSKEKDKQRFNGANPTVGSPEKSFQQLHLPPGRSIFDVFPNEIIIAIVEHMPVRDKDSFSQCSKLCYEVSFPLRRSLVLTPESIERFQNGGSCQHLRGLIQCLRFGDIWVKDIRQMPRANNIDESFRDIEIDFEALVTNIHISTTALKLFPNAQELYISYMAPRNCEFNIYTAILRGMLGLPICNSLQRLEIQITRERNVRQLTHYNYWSATDWVPPADPSYSEFYAKLSPENQEFLGNEQNNSTINEVMSEITPKFPALTEARIVAHNLPTPMEKFHESRFSQTAFYYLPLMFAPKLEKLRIETERCRGQGYERKGWFDSRLLGEALSRIKDLGVINSQLEEIDILILAGRFPHLRHLDLQTIERIPLPLTVEDYAPLGELKNLEYVKLPWPSPRRSGSIPAEAMRKWVKGMLDRGLDQLQTVELLGSRYNATRYERTDIDLQFSVKRTEKSCLLDMRGATTKAEYADDKGRY